MRPVIISCVILIFMLQSLFCLFGVNVRNLNFRLLIPYCSYYILSPPSPQHYIATQLTLFLSGSERETGIHFYRQAETVNPVYTLPSDPDREPSIRFTGKPGP